MAFHIRQRAFLLGVGVERGRRHLHDREVCKASLINGVEVVLRIKLSEPIVVEDNRFAVVVQALGSCRSEFREGEAIKVIIMENYRR